jgi:membrane-bound metal-dependent hydrolase YbcI (DUF457 family)
VAPVSWAAHDVEPYVIRRHMEKLERRLGFRVSFVAILLGSWGPDIFTKYFVYGVNLGGVNIRAGNPAQFHREWPGAGFTHSLAFGVAVALLFFAITRSKGWSAGLMVGIWAHVLSDTLDSNGVMLFFPISTARVHFDAWAYAGETGRFLDGSAYFSSLGFIWDLFWISVVLLNWRVLRLDYFRTTVVPGDPFWAFAGRRLPESALVVLYRGAFFYGTCRWFGWLLWVHVLNSHPFDLSWGGPYWVPPLPG